jgi:hypothetical protein
LFQHLQDVAIDQQNGIFEGTNDLVEKLGGRPPIQMDVLAFGVLVVVSRWRGRSGCQLRVMRRSAI